MAQDYTIVNDKTGEEKTISWEGKAPPTSEDIQHITLQLSATGPQPALKPTVDNDPLNTNLYTPTGVENGDITRKADPITGKGKQSLLSDYIPSRKTISDFIRPTLEGGGMILGDMAAIPFALETAGTAVPALGGAGYVAGKRLADFIEGKDVPLSEIPKEWLTGAEYAVGGALIGKGIQSASPYMAKYLSRMKSYIPGTDAKAERLALELFADKSAAATPELAAQYAANAAEAQTLSERVGLPRPFTPGQATNNKALSAMEKSLATKDGNFGAQLADNNMANAQRATNNLDSSLPKNIAAPEIQPPSLTGSAQRGELRADKTASQKNVSALYDGINGEYTHPIPQAKEALKVAKTEFQTPEVESALSRIDAMLDGKTLNTKTAIDLDKYLSQVMRDNMNSTPSVTKAVGRVRDGLKQDFRSMGEAAQRGDIAISNGNLVSPSAIQTEIAALEQRKLLEAAQGATLPEKNKHLFEYLARNKEVVLQNLGISNEQYAKSLADRLAYLQKKGIGIDYAPPTAGTNAKVISDIEAGIADKQAVLNALQPAENVAAQYSKAHSAALDHIKKYGQSEIRKVLNYGNTMGGGQIAEDTVSKVLFTPEGAKQFVNAQGQYKASGLATPHVEAMLFDPINGITKDGVMNIHQALKTIDKHASALETLGLKKHAEQLVKEQMPATIRAELEAVRAYNPDDPVKTAAAAAQWARKYAPAMKRLFGSNAEAQAMQDYARIMRIISRNKNAQYATGSDSMAIWFGDAPKNSKAAIIWDALGTVLIGTGGGYALHGAMGGVGGAIAGKVAGEAISKLNQSSRNTAVAIIQKAVTDPEAARFLMKLGNKTKVTPAEINRILSTLAGYTFTPSR